MEGADPAGEDDDPTGRAGGAPGRHGIEVGTPPVACCVHSGGVGCEGGAVGENDSRDISCRWQFLCKYGIGGMGKGAGILFPALAGMRSTV